MQTGHPASSHPASGPHPRPGQVTVPARDGVVRSRPTAPPPVAPHTRDVVAQRLKVLGHPVRLRLLELLLPRARSVNELAVMLDLEHYAVSKHLCELHRAGLVRRTQDGNFARYALVDVAPIKVLLLMAQSFEREAARLAALAAPDAG